jgi:signal transduction histidine kinase
MPGWSWTANGLLALAILLRLLLGPERAGEVVYLPAVAAAALHGGFGPGCALAFAVSLADVLLAALSPGAGDAMPRPWLLLGSGLVVSLIGGITQRLLSLRTSEALVANALLRFGRSVGDPTQIPALQRAVVDSAPPLIDCDYAAVFVWNEDLRQFDLAAQTTGAEQRGFHYYAAASVARWQRRLSETGAQPMDAAGLEALPLRDARGRPLLRRALWVPMRRWGRLLGGVLFGSTLHAGAFSSWEIRIAEGVSGQVAVAMEGAEAFEALESRADEIRRLLRLGKDLNAHLDLAQLRRRIAENAAALAQARIAAVGLWDEGTLYFEECCVGREWRPMPRREPLGETPAIARGTTTGLALIIAASGGEPLGVVELYARAGEAPFTSDDARLLSGLVNVAAVAIQNARLYERLRRQHAQLRELERLRDDLTHMVVHDLRTPLTGILTALQTLEAGVVGELPKEAAAINEIALDNATELLGMVNDLLDVSKLESGQMPLEREPVAASVLVTRATRQVERLFLEKCQSLEVTLARDLPPVEADVDKATRILVNLLGNAIKFTPTGGSIAVVVGPDPYSEQVAFQVMDTGTGIPSQFHSRIFEKFAQVEDAPGRDGADGRTAFSTGLGLTYCKMATEAHGGRIGVQSEPGAGSTFTFTLPIAPAALAEAEAPRSHAAVA